MPLLRLFAERVLEQRGFHPLWRSPAPLLQPVTGAALSPRSSCAQGPLSKPDAAAGLRPDTSGRQVGGSRGSTGARLGPAWLCVCRRPVTVVLCKKGGSAAVACYWASRCMAVDTRPWAEWRSREHLV